MSDPHITYPTVPGSGEVYVKDLSDILKLLPGEWKSEASAPIRDAIASALLGVLQELQAAVGYSAAQADALRATDRYLTGLADDRGYVPAPSEDIETFRARLSDTPELVTYDAIVALVSDILAIHSPTPPRVFDSVLDRWFVTDGTGAYHSYVGAAPDYPDRLYPHHADVNDGISLPQSHPTGAWAFGDCIGRYFVVVVPDISPRDTDISLPYDGTVSDGAFYIGDGTSSLSSSFILAEFQTALTVYQTIANAVERISGQGIRWQLFADPNLTS